MDGEKGTLGRGMHGFFMDLRFSFEMDGEKSLAVKKWFINGI